MVILRFIIIENYWIISTSEESDSLFMEGKAKVSCQLEKDGQDFLTTSLHFWNYFGNSGTVEPELMEVFSKTIPDQHEESRVESVDEIEAWFQ